MFYFLRKAKTLALPMDINVSPSHRHSAAAIPHDCDPSSYIRGSAGIEDCTVIEQLHLKF